MDYQKIYDSLVKKFQGLQDRDLANSKYFYVESHHVQPRCMGGSDESENLVFLPAREHFIAHRLLCKIHPEHSGIAWALYMMSNVTRDRRKYKVTARTYSFIKKELSRIGRDERSRENIRKGQIKRFARPDQRKLAAEICRQRVWTLEMRAKASAAKKGKSLSDEHKEKIRVSQIGRTHSDQSKQKMSSSRSGKPVSDEHKEKIRSALIGRKTGKRSDKTRRKISESKLARKIPAANPET